MDEKELRKAEKAAKQAEFMARMDEKKRRRDAIKALPEAEQKEALKKLKAEESAEFSKGLREQEAAKLAEKLKDPVFAAKHAEKLRKQEKSRAESAAFEERMAKQKAEKEAIKALSPEEQKAAKKAASEAFSQRLRDEEAAKLAEKLKDPVFAAKHAAKEAKRLKFEAEMAAREQEKRDLAEKIGKKVADEFFAEKRVRIYENGYIEIGLGLLSSPEKLESIQSSADVTKKSGLGRAAAAVLTNGMNLLSANRRGDLMLVIETDEESHVLHTENATTEYMKAMKKLEAVGNAVLARIEGKDSEVEASNSNTDITEKLAELNKLHLAGALTDDEFTKAKSKLLS